MRACVSACVWGCVWRGLCLLVRSVVAVLVLYVLFDYWLACLTGFGYGCRLFRVVAGGGGNDAAAVVAAVTLQQ